MDGDSGADLEDGKRLLGAEFLLQPPFCHFLEQDAFCRVMPIADENIAVSGRTACLLQIGNQKLHDAGQRFPASPLDAGGVDLSILQSDERL